MNSGLLEDVLRISSGIYLTRPANNLICKTGSKSFKGLRSFFDKRLSIATWAIVVLGSIFLNKKIF